MSDTAAGPPAGGGGDQLHLLFGGALVEQLGAQLYPNATATVAELISNSWDADATHVWVKVPFDDWKPDATIEVVDDGHGMDREEVKRYLIVGRKRRIEDHGKSEGGRDVHGRKGIGKLAAFGTAGSLELVTRRRGSPAIAIRLDYDAIRRLQPDQPFPVEELTDFDPLTDPKTGAPLDHGTRVRLTKLRQRKSSDPAAFMLSMTRRFAFDDADMKVEINSDELKRFDYPVQFRFPGDGLPAGAKDDDGWAVETVDGQEVRWWIGFTEKPLDDEGVQGVSILARRKMAQRPFKFETVQGRTGQLGQEYLVGEVIANWLDVGEDIEDDLIQSNRDQLQLEDERLESLLEWGRKRLRWALSRRNELRKKTVVDAFEASEELKGLLATFTPTERARFLAIARTASELPEISSDDVLGLMRQIVNAREDQAVRELMERIEAEDDAFQSRMWMLVGEFGLIDARRTYSLIEARLATIKQLERTLEEGAREVPDIHKIITRNSWLLDPRWDSLGHEVDIEKMGIRYEGEKDPDTGRYIDYLFALSPRPPAARDQIVVVELKRGAHPDGRPRKATGAEVYKFNDYVQSAVDHFAKNKPSPRVRGLMVANDYTADAERARRPLTQSASPVMDFKTWETVLDETERLHLSWLEVTGERLKEADGGRDVGR